jgi:hypothetical protein
VDTLTRWVEEHRAHLALALQEALSRIEQADLLSPPPQTRGGDLSPGRPGTTRTAVAPSVDAGRPPAVAPAETDSPGPATVAWQPEDDSPAPEGKPPADGPATDPPGGADPYIAELRRAVSEQQPLGPREDEPPREPSAEEGNDEFYDQDAGDSRRLGRLRRRH